MTDRVINTMLSMQRYPWEQGVCAQALYEYERDDLWIPMAYDAVKRMGRDGRLAMIGGEPAVSGVRMSGFSIGGDICRSPGSLYHGQRMAE